METTDDTGAIKERRHSDSPLSTGRKGNEDLRISWTSHGHGRIGVRHSLRWLTLAVVLPLTVLAVFAARGVQAQRRAFCPEPFSTQQTRALIRGDWSTARDEAKYIAPPFPDCIGCMPMLVSWREWLVRTPVLGCEATGGGSRTPRRVARQARAGIWLLERLADAGGILWQAAPCADRRRHSFAQSTGLCLLPRLVPTPRQ